NNIVSQHIDNFSKANCKEETVSLSMLSKKSTKESQMKPSKVNSVPSKGTKSQSLLPTASKPTADKMAPSACSTETSSSLSPSASSTSSSSARLRTAFTSTQIIH